MSKSFGIGKENAKVLLRLFREQQRKHNGRSGCYCSDCEHDMRLALREFYKLVPVVSVEWLENAFEMLLEDIANDDESPLSFTMAKQIQDKIISWAKKEPEKTRRWKKK